LNKLTSSPMNHFRYPGHCLPYALLMFMLICTTCRQEEKGKTREVMMEALSATDDESVLPEEQEVIPLEIGAEAPDFELVGVDSLTYSLSDFREADILVIMFICNHCPTAQAYEDKINSMVEAYKDDGVAFVAISPNYPGAVAYSELGYSDLDDSFESMQVRAREKNYAFPYLYDGATQSTALKYGPAATPHVFIFDAERKLRYSGRIDDTENPYIEPGQTDAVNAIEALLAGQPVPVEKTKTFGCSIKWAWKRYWVESQNKQWAESVVSLYEVDEKVISGLIRNDSEKLRLLNVWATYCGPCVIEYPAFIDMHRMYRGRGFEFVSISADNPAQKEKVMEFLTGNHSAVSNYIFNSTDKYALIEAVDPQWQGNLPYTVLVAPGGEVLFKKMGELDDPLEVRKAIIAYLGRYYADDK
jgi:peroxiredoxin